MHFALKTVSPSAKKFGPMMVIVQTPAQTVTMQWFFVEHLSILRPHNVVCYVFLLFMLSLEHGQQDA